MSIVDKPVDRLVVTRVSKDSDGHQACATLAWPAVEHLSIAEFNALKGRDRVEVLRYVGDTWFLRRQGRWPAGGELAGTPARYVTDMTTGRLVAYPSAQSAAVAS